MGVGLAVQFHEFFPYHFTHILIPNLLHPGIRLQRYITFSTCMSDRNHSSKKCIFSLGINYLNSAIQETLLSG